MNQIKRKLSVSGSSEKKIKKLPMRTSIEGLSNEFFYEIFDYLDGCEIYQAFSNLNYRFHQLLNSSSLLFKIKPDKSTSKELFINNYKQFILHHEHKILSIHLCLPTDNNQAISSLNIDSSFIHLQSLVFDSIEPEILRLLLPQLVSLPRLFSLTINIWYTLKELKDIYQFIFQLQKLKYIKFSALESENSTITVSLPTATNNQFSAIEYLVVDHPCTFNELFTMISHTPQLYRLNCMDLSNHDLSIKVLSPMTLTNLNSIYMDMCQITFNELEIFIGKIPSKLKVFSFATLLEDITYLNADRWEEFILKYLPDLEKFYLKYSERYDNDYEPRFYDGKKNQFISPFWVERQWIFETEIEFDEMIYFIRPYKKRWYDHGVQNSMINSSTQSRVSSRLIIAVLPTQQYGYTLGRIICHILFVAQILHLEIYEKIFIDMLIKTVLSFVHMNSLKISSLSLSNPKGLLSDINEKVRSFVIDNNQIKNVYLVKLNDIEEIYSLMKLFPRIIYLKVDYLNNMDMEFFLRTILKKVQRECNEHLRLLCLRIPAATDQVLETFDQMIRSERLLFDYTIKRVLDNIYLQWK